MSTFVEMVREIERQRGTRVDLRAPSQGIRFAVGDAGDVSVTVTENGARALAPLAIRQTSSVLAVTGLSAAAAAYSVDGVHEATWPVHPHALSQVFDWLDIPARYGSALRTGNPALLETVMNSSVQSRDDAERRMVRVTDGRMMAVLSDGYRAMDNADLVEKAVLPILSDRSDLQISHSAMSDTRLYVQLTSERLRGTVRTGDDVAAMVTIRNSEYGDGSLAVESGTLRLVCMNGAVVARVLRKNHVSATVGGEGVQTEAALADDTRRARDTALWLTLRDSVAEQLNPDAFAKLLEAHKAAADDEIERARPDVVVERTAKRFGLDDDERFRVLNALLIDRDLTRYGLAQAVTVQAHTATPDRAYALQTIGGALLTMPAGDWRDLDSRRN